MLSIIYVLSAIGVISMLLLFPKSEDKQEIIIWIPICYITYECIISLNASIFTIFHIPANLFSLGLLNVIVSIMGGIWIKKTGEIQKYYLDIENLLFFLALIIVVVFVGYERYGRNFQICFETSDPGTHLKMAMDTVNSQSVITTMSTTLFVTPFTNGVFIRILFPLFHDTDIYKSFIIKELINFGLSGMVFYSCIYKHLKARLFRMFGIGVVLFYLFGYPYCNLLFGFSYLGFAVTIITYLIFITDFYLGLKNSNRISLLLISLGCFGVAECYTFFAPFVFVGVFLSIAYKNKREKGGIICSKQFYINELMVFLMPALLTVLFTIVYPHFVGDLGLSGDYITDLMMEGYNYRNLYSDFLIYIPFALYAIYYQIKKEKKYNANTAICLSLFFYLIICFIAMYYERMSSYYYYKLNFVVWMLVLLLFVEGTYYICTNTKELVFFYCGCWGIVFLLWFTEWDMGLYEKNVLYNPFPSSKSCFVIYDHNRIIRERKSTISPELVQLCKEVSEKYKSENQLVLYLGNWLDKYWYEALTNQRQTLYSVYNPFEFTQSFINGEYGDYLAVAKDDETLGECYLLLQNSVVIYENDYGIIVQRPKE